MSWSKSIEPRDDFRWHMRKPERQRSVEAMGSGSQTVWPLSGISFLDIDWRNSIVVADADKNAHHPVAAKAVGIKRHGADDSFDVREWDQIMRRGAPEARSSCNEILQPSFGQPLRRNLHRLAHWPVP